MGKNSAVCITHWWKRYLNHHPLFTINESPIENRDLGTTFPLLLYSTGGTTSKSIRKIKEKQWQALNSKSALHIQTSATELIPKLLMGVMNYLLSYTFTMVLCMCHPWKYWKNHQVNYSLWDLILSYYPVDKGCSKDLAQYIHWRWMSPRWQHRKLQKSPPSMNILRIQLQMD